VVVVEVLGESGLGWLFQTKVLVRDMRVWSVGIGVRYSTCVHIEGEIERRVLCEGKGVVKGVEDMDGGCKGRQGGEIAISAIHVVCPARATGKRDSRD